MYLAMFLQNLYFYESLEYESRAVRESIRDVMTPLALK